MPPPSPAVDASQTNSSLSDQTATRLPAHSLIVSPPCAASSECRTNKSGAKMADSEALKLNKNSSFSHPPA